ncbi:MAG: DUF512 domain-containing protein [Clostridiales bacterium]|jgi:putative radical SAM enzyme (TIGR03279 family)|nr:DUF512 domain-containing protein [Clostridiales bacterium]
MVPITEVAAHSRAARQGICSGDVLLSINGHEIQDVLDYRFFLAEKNISLCLSRGGEVYTVSIHKQEYDDIGLSFETPLMDKKHTCENKCVFCFIDQNPKGMRESIYFKDDDSRLSFLHGNYITMTNLKPRDIQRIIDMHISPVNVSVHTTNPELRNKMMNNKHAGEVLEYLKMLSDAGVTIRGQIVLCKGLNDGRELDRTMEDLTAYYPSLDSVSIVPAGLTKHRKNLYPLEPFTPEECAGIIYQVNAFGEQCIEKFGERIFFPADEFYVKSKTPLPNYEFFGEYTQIENGVGMLSSFMYEFLCLLDSLTDAERQIHRNVSIATGEAAADMMLELVDRLSEACPNLQVYVYPIKNNFFGGEVTVTGLLTGKDIAQQLQDKPLGDVLLLSRNVLRNEGDLFLCGMTPEELSKKLNVPLLFNRDDGGSFLCNLLGIEE